MLHNVTHLPSPIPQLATLNLCQARAKPPTAELDPRDNVLLGHGKGLTPRQSEISAIGEALEAYASCHDWNQRERRATFNQLKGLALDPRALTVDTSLGNYNDDLVQGWMPGDALVNDRKLLVPSLGCFLNCRIASENERYIEPTTNGLAAGPSLAKAILNGACEVIERDAFLSAWLRQSRLSRRCVETHPDPAIRALVAALRSGGFETVLCSVPSDYAIPVFATCLIRATGEGPVAAVGAAADINESVAASSSIQEAAQVLASLSLEWPRQTIRNHAAHIAANPHLVTEPYDHMLFHAHSITSELDWFVDARPCHAQWASPTAPARTRDALRQVVQEVAANNGEIIYVELTPKHVLSAGLHVVRVIIPFHQPMFFGSALTRVAPKNTNASRCQIFDDIPTGTTSSGSAAPHPLG